MSQFDSRPEDGESRKGTEKNGGSEGVRDSRGGVIWTGKLGSESETKVPTPFYRRTRYGERESPERPVYPLSGVRLLS